MDDFDKQAEAFHQELYREYYQAESGLKERLNIEPIYDRYAHLFEETMVKQLLGEAQHRRGRYLAEWVTLEYLEDSVKGLTESISNAMRRATVEWGGQQLSYHNLRPTISNEPDMSRRHHLHQLYRDVTASVNQERERRFSSLHTNATHLGFESYIALCEQLRRLNLDSLTKEMRSLLHDTAQVFFRHLEKFLAGIEVPVEDAATCDMWYLFRGPSFDALFPKESMIPTLRATLAGMGIDLRQQENLELDTDSRELKSPRAFCAPIRVPEEVKLVIKPMGGASDYSSLLHEAGHAEHFANVDPDLPFAFKRLGDNSVTETYAFLFQYLFLNRRWLRRVLGVEEPSRLIRYALFEKLWFLRRYGIKLLYEQELHRELDGAEKRYVSLLGDGLGIAIAAEDYLADVDDAFYCAQYLRAWILEVQLRRFLEDQYGLEWFASQGAGKYLLSLWRRGQKLSPEEIAADIGYDGLDSTYLVEELLSIENDAGQ